MDLYFQFKPFAHRFLIARPDGKGGLICLARAETLSPSLNTNLTTDINAKKSIARLFLPTAQIEIHFAKSANLFTLRVKNKKGWRDMDAFYLRGNGAALVEMVLRWVPEDEDLRMLMSQFAALPLDILDLLHRRVAEASGQAGSQEMQVEAKSTQDAT